MAFDRDPPSSGSTTGPGDPVLSALLREDDASSDARDDQAWTRLWTEAGGLRQSPNYSALLGAPTWRERLVSLRETVGRPLSWRIALPLVPVGAAAVFAAFLLMPGATQVQYRSGNQPRSVTLPDRSTVALAPSSEVHFRIEDGKRIASLVGAARFSVAHDAKRPFLVNVGDAQLRVVGTQFNLSYRRPCAQLSVLSGTVDVTSPAMAQRRLNADEETVTVDRGQPYRACLEGAPSGSPMRWSYVDVPLSTVIADVGRFLPQSVVIRAPEIARERVTMSLTGTEITRIDELIPEIVEVRIDYGKDGTIYIDRKR